MGRFYHDHNAAYTDIPPGTVQHHWHLYGRASTSQLKALGHMTGFYAHLDGEADMPADVTVESLAPLRGNGTWGVDGTLRVMRGCFASARVVTDTSARRPLPGNGTIEQAFGGWFESAIDTEGQGTISSAHGVYGQVRNTKGASIYHGTGIMSHVRNQASGGGIEHSYGFRALVDDPSEGIRRYRAYHATIPRRPGWWALYLDGDAPSHIHELRVGTTTDRNAPLAVGGAINADGPLHSTEHGYAERFEWLTAPPSDDPAGITVVLESGRVRPATPDDPPSAVIGAVTANAAVIGGQHGAIVALLGRQHVRPESPTGDRWIPLGEHEWLIR